MKATMKSIVCGVIASCALGAAAFAQDAHQGQRMISWSGQVDDTVIVRIHGDRVRTMSIHGAAPVNVTPNVFEPLPERPVHVWLTEVHGRGSVRLIQEPRFDNDYTAVVRLKDPQHGPEYYSFVLRWNNRMNGGANDNDRDND